MNSPLRIVVPCFVGVVAALALATWLMRAPSSADGSHDSSQSASGAPDHGEDPSPSNLSQSLVRERPPDAQSRICTIADLPAKRIAWITRNYEANLASLAAKISDPDILGKGLQGDIAYLELLKEIGIVIAQLELLKAGDVLLVSDLPAPKPDHLRLQEFSFADNIAVTADRLTIASARLVYDIDLSRHPDIRELDNRIAALSHAASVDDAHKFNSLDDETRARRISDFGARWAEHMEAREAISKLDKGAPDYLVRLSELWKRVQAARVDCESLVPGSIAVDLKSGIARPAR
jgi:hypothetical protein